MSLAKQLKRHEWEIIVSGRKEAGLMSMFDDEFDCPSCGEVIDYETFMDGDEPYGCPHCGIYLEE